MTDVLIKRGTLGHRDRERKGRMLPTEVEIGVMELQAKGCQGLKATTRIWEEAREDSPLQVKEGVCPCQHLDLRL